MNIETGPGRLNYHSCRYGSSKMLFRGPARRVRGDYIAFLGGSETFGRFIVTPFPDLVEDLTGMTAINLGCPRVGVDAYLNAPGLIDICSMAKVTVIQIMGAANMSNRFYTVDPRHNERFLRASKRLKELYPDIDFSKFQLTSEILTELAQHGSERLQTVRQELQCAWVARMRSLMSEIDGSKVLLWMADHAPYRAGDGGTICRDPLFVDRAMLNAVKNDADVLVEVVGEPTEITAGRKRMIFSDLDRNVAQDLLGPMVHDRVSDLLEQAIMGMVAKSKAKSLMALDGDIDNEPVENLFI